MALEIFHRIMHRQARAPTLTILQGALFSSELAQTLGGTTSNGTTTRGPLSWTRPETPPCASGSNLLGKPQLGRAHSRQLRLHRIVRHGCAPHLATSSHVRYADAAALALCSL